MKKLFVTSLCMTLIGCASFGVWYSKHEIALRQAFGNAIRSLEGSALASDATKIPSAIQHLASLWLPQTGSFGNWVNDAVIQPFVAAHPVTVDQVNKVLETI